MSQSDGHSDAGVPSNAAPDQEPIQAPVRRVAARVDSGLAGLLAGVLARAGSEADNVPETEADTEPETETEFETEFETWSEAASHSACDEVELKPKVEAYQRSFSVVHVEAEVEPQFVEPMEHTEPESVPLQPVLDETTVEAEPTWEPPAEEIGEPVLSWDEVGATPTPATWEAPAVLSLRTTAVAATPNDEVPPPSAPDWNTLPALDPQPEIATWADADRVLDLDEGAVAPAAFRWSDESLSPAPTTTSIVEAVVEPRLVLTPVDLEPEEQELLLEGLSQVRARAGEEGLPFAVVHLELSGGGLGPGTGEVTRRYIQSIVRDGDVVVRLGDRSVAMMCGGLFFPGDMEVVGERIRAQLYQSRQVLFNVDDLNIVVAGALMAAGEEISEFLTRGASARFHATSHRRTDVLIDYVSHSLSR